MDAPTLATPDDYMALWEYGNADIERVTSALLAAETLLNGQCGRTLIAANYSERRSGDNTRVLVLASWPIISITSLTVGGATWDVLTGIAADVGQPVFLPPSGRWLEARSGYVFSRGSGNIVVVYRAGFEPGSVPPDLITATCFIAKLCLEELNKIGTGGKTLGPEQVNLVVRKFAEYPMIGLTITRYSPGY